MLAFFLFLLSQSCFSQTEERIAITAATPYGDTGQNYQPWLDDNLANEVENNWSEENQKYVAVILTLAKKTQLSRLALYDGQGEFEDKPAYLFALNNGTKTYIGKFDGQQYQAWADLPVSATATADALMVWKFGNNIPQKIKVYGNGAADADASESSAAPVVLAPPAPLKTSTSGRRITIEVTFDQAPGAASSTLTDLKYDKQAVLQFEVDDNNSGAVPIANYLARGSGHPTLTDGCGNAVNYRLAVAVNGRSNYDNQDNGSGLSGRATWAQLAALVQDGNALENHGYYHDMTGNYNFGGDIARNLRENVAFVYNRLKNQGVEYRMRTVVRPNADPGYVRAADAAGYLGATSQGEENGYAKYPKYAKTVDVQTLPAGGFVHLGRNFSELSSSEQINDVKQDVDQLLAGSNASTHLLYRVGTHLSSLSAAQSVFGHLAATANDRVWVTHMDELLEYLEVKRRVVKSEALSGNKLTITLDYGNVPAINRYRDLSLRVRGGTIQSVKVSGADRSSYNRRTGLINVFEQNTSFADPAKDTGLTSGPADAALRAAVPAPAPIPAETQAQLSAYPNPFLTQTTVQFALPEAGLATLDLLDVSGKVVRHLFAGPVAAGTPQQLPLSREGFTQKFYILRLITARKVLTHKLGLTP
ncbi:hypothetical protein [uncultured Hymenobacter sp.]|uniref:hypothetical protein n=1 Tax=uncultured Hymenobacter sp. TaxID=170016 RepID=UPI0035CA31EE